MKRPIDLVIVLSFLLFCLPFYSVAQKMVTERGEALVRIEKNLSEDQTLSLAKEKAKINAIENAFGSVLVQGNSTYIDNKTEGGKVETNIRFNLITNTLVNGEWIETLDEQSEIIDNKDGYHYVKYTIKGRIRELPKNATNFKCYTLTCPETKCETTIYNSGQDFYLLFKAAQDGYISVYADYEGETFRILPYQKSSLNNIKLVADQEYIFFDKLNDKSGDVKGIVDRINLVAEKEMEAYKLFVLFSNEDFSKPILSDKSKDMLSAQLQTSGYKLPKSLKSEEFQKWLNAARSKNSSIQLEIISIAVKK